LIFSRSFSDFAQHLHTNTIGPLLTAQHLLRLSTPLSPDHPVSPTYTSPVIPLHIRTLVFMSSDSGSTMNFRSFEDGFGAYAASKAALNQALRHLAAELHRKSEELSESDREKKDAPVVLAIHPGEVATDMAADADLSWEVEGIITPEESVRNVLQVIEDKGKGGHDEGGTKSARGEGRKVEPGEAAFFTWEGKRYPW
jgi:NAD(P)-dependent dehydrogenase (short-subunit alcohol dehydrogenase family)